MGEKPPVESIPDQPSDEGDSSVVYMDDYIDRHPYVSIEHPELADKILGLLRSEGFAYFYNDDDYPEPPDDSPDDNAS